MSPTLQDDLKDGFGERMLFVCGMPERCKFPSLESCQKRFLWTHKGVDLAPHPVVGLSEQSLPIYKLKLHKSVVTSILFYGCETWTLLTDSEKKDLGP